MRRIWSVDINGGRWLVMRKGKIIADCGEEGESFAMTIVKLLNEDEVIKARNGGALPVLDATKMCRPGDEPLA
jgi:hypothetical protein